MNYGDGETQGYGFDAMGNRLTKNEEEYTYNAANMLLTRGSFSYTNDQNGNTLTGGGRTMTWDSQNRMASCAYGGQTSTFTYGADGLRRRMVTGNKTVDYLLDGQNVVREYTTQNGQTNTTASYLWGPRGPEYKRDQAGNCQWYVYDGLGSVVGTVDAAGTLTNTRAYDVYGAVRGQAGTDATTHKFCGALGHSSEDETGLIYMRARYMDPVTGRFVSEDPKQDGFNWFLYVNNDPVNHIDASGRFGLFVGILLIIAAYFVANAIAGLVQAVAASGRLATNKATAEAIEAMIAQWQPRNAENADLERKEMHDYAVRIITGDQDDQIIAFAYFEKAVFAAMVGGGAGMAYKIYKEAKDMQ